MLDLQLRKKRELSDCLTMQLVRYTDGVTGQIMHVEDPGDVFDVPLEHVDKLVVLWDHVAQACMAGIGARASVKELRISGEPSLSATGAEVLVERLVDVYRPIVAQLIDHGAATGELSLKRDLGDGRREERFVSLVHLVEKVSALTEADRARLAGLGLDRYDGRRRSGPISVAPPSAMPPPVPLAARR